MSAKEEHVADTVYLHSFPSVPHVYSISPFTLKVQSFMRINQISYETIGALKFGPKGKIPYATVNGETIADSNVIVSHLSEHFKTRSEEGLTPEQLAMTHATTRMIEEHTAQIGFYYRYGLHMTEFCESLDVTDRLFGAFTWTKALVSCCWQRGQPKATIKKMEARGLAGHSDEELWKFSFDDLVAISQYVGDKQYFHGARATLADCVLFGHLVQYLYIPIDFPQKQFLHEKCSNLVRLVETFRMQYWPDWNALCEGTELKVSKEVIET